ncbi:MAG: tRNA 2-thiouridine(34) synthase MnmA [Planctomycetes bacterium]|nr:tRNA 2-thiouridine(34) synthase MnmA [Planctomycetota bacterium]
MKIAALLSGGVDSSVALRLLREEGHRDLTAYYLKVWLEDELSHLGGCPWEEDLRFARAVCEAAGVELEIIPLQTEYYRTVVAYALSELKAGRTPSPDIFCNQRIKFGAFLEQIGESFDRVATGHYARIRSEDGLRYLLRGVDPVKDQTYFLSHLSQGQLARILFPVGALKKSEVRRLAAELDLPSRDREESQGICFLGKIRFDEFVRSHLGERKGPIIERDTGRLLGEHRGYWFHTIGQRKGLGLSQGPWFVVGKDVESNVIYVAHGRSLSRHARSVFRAADPSWIARPPGRADLEVKLRHSEKLYRCRLEEESGGRLRVELEGSDTGVAPGQFAVFYEGDICLGGARII